MKPGGSGLGRNMPLHKSAWERSRVAPGALRGIPWEGHVAALVPARRGKPRAPSIPPKWLLFQPRPKAFSTKIDEAGTESLVKQFFVGRVALGTAGGAPRMRDYVKSRPAKVGEKLRTQHFHARTVGFAPGTELAFATAIRCSPRGLFGWKVIVVKHTTATFRQINKENPRTHHDALEFPDGRMVLLTHLLEGQEATVLQLPAQPVTAAETKAQKRIRNVR
jgi:hypothetical protein